MRQIFVCPVCLEPRRTSRGGAVVGRHDRTVARYSGRLKRWVNDSIMCHGSGKAPLVRDGSRFVASPEVDESEP